jgi:hypothetical protein
MEENIERGFGHIDAHKRFELWHDRDPWLVMRGRGPWQLFGLNDRLTGPCLTLSSIAPARPRPPASTGEALSTPLRFTHSSTNSTDKPGHDNSDPAKIQPALGYRTSSGRLHFLGFAHQIA